MKFCPLVSVLNPCEFVLFILLPSSMPVAVETWAGQICAGDVRAIARAITAIEGHDPHAEELLKQIFASTGRAHVVGVTGAPGTGKSTLVDRLAAHYRSRGDQVGII